MGSRSDLYCWEIMQCENPDDCPAKKNPGKPCWEIATESDDYRKANNICRDCIVHVLKVGKSALSKQEIKNIMEKKISCKLAHRYPRLSA
jgi:hypothetical protein